MQDSRLTVVYDGYQTELTKSGKGCQDYPGNHPLQGQQRVKVYTVHQTHCKVSNRMSKIRQHNSRKFEPEVASNAIKNTSFIKLTKYIEIWVTHNKNTCGHTHTCTRLHACVHARTHAHTHTYHLHKTAQVHRTQDCPQWKH